MRLKINIKKKAMYYNVLIGKGLLNRIPKILKKKPLGNNYVIITDSNVKKLYGDKLLKDLKKEKIEAILISFKAGEKSKNKTIKEKIENKIIESCLSRGTAIIALGGGVVGDLAGFIAATFYRGINFIQVPTTLLAQTDSSIGGKAAIDHPLGKNLIGAFYHPKLVVTDIDILKSLPKKELINGLAEIIKHSLILNKDFFIFLEKNIKKIISLDEKILISTIKKSCEIKKRVVEKDEKEKNFRKILNFGHTIGHSLELVSKYRLSHGQAVSIGIAAEAQISKELGLLKKKDVHRIKSLLEKASLPVKIPKNITAKKIIDAAKFDKKAIKKIPHYVLLERVGKAKLNVKVPNKIISKVICNLK